MERRVVRGYLCPAGLCPMIGRSREQRPSCGGLHKELRWRLAGETRQRVDLPSPTDYHQDNDSAKATATWEEV